MDARAVTVEVVTAGVTIERGLSVFKFRESTNKHMCDRMES